MAEKHFDRTTEDVGNIVNLGHVNVQVADQGLATAFYVTGLGLTRDPYLMTGTNNMWVNVGMSQFHLPTDKAQVLRGRIGLVMPELDSLVERLEAVKKPLKGTKFGFKAPNGNAAVDVTCPWGNRLTWSPMALRYWCSGRTNTTMITDTPTNAHEECM